MILQYDGSKLLKNVLKEMIYLNTAPRFFFWKLLDMCILATILVHLSCPL